MYRVLFFFLVALISSAHSQDFLLYSTGADFSNSYIFASGKQSILFDSQLTKSDTQKIIYALNNQVVNPIRSLTYILVTSDDPRSYLGLSSLAAAFPKAKIVSTPGIVASIGRKSAAAIAALLANNITDINTEVPKISPIPATFLTVGSTRFDLTEETQVGGDYILTIWDASTSSLFPGFVHNGLFPDLAYNFAANSFRKYQVTLRNYLIKDSPILHLYPRFGPALNSSTQISNTFLQYISYVDDYLLAIAAPNTREQAFATLTYKYPVLQGKNFLSSSLAASISVCVPSCGARTCGDDGCGGSCGTCAAPSTCNAFGNCECQSQCNGRFCGDDGCGRTCGTCKFGTCSKAGVCACSPNCGADSCGDDGCGGVCQCAPGKVCTGGLKCVAPGGNSVGIKLNLKGLVSTQRPCGN